MTSFQFRVPPLSMKTIAFACVAIFGLAQSASAASIYEEARKVCTQRYNDDLSAGAVPERMPKSKYISQCTNSYVRNANPQYSFENEENFDNMDGGRGGPEILPPQKAAPVMKNGKPVPPTPRFKPQN